MDNNKDELYGAIMNIPCDESKANEEYSDRRLAYKHGHRDARHAAAELVNESEAAQEVTQQAAEAETAEQANVFAAPAGQLGAVFRGTIDAGEYNRETGMMRVTVKLPFKGLPEALLTINAPAFIAPADESEATQCRAEGGNTSQVGCERDDGLLNIHAESETCEVCSAPAAGTEKDAKRLLIVARDALEAMLMQFTRIPSTLADTSTRGQAHAALADIRAHTKAKEGA